MLFYAAFALRFTLAEELRLGACAALTRWCAPQALGASAPAEANDSDEGVHR